MSPVCGIFFIKGFKNFESLRDLSRKKSRIRETSNLSTDADRRTDINFESLRDLSRKKGWFMSTHSRFHASTRQIHAGAKDALHPPPVFRAPRV